MTEPKKKKDKSGFIFKFILFTCFGFLALFKLAELYVGPSYLERKHRAHIYKSPANISANTLKNNEGEIVRISDFAGQKLLLAYWAPWCKYCKQEIPIIDDLNQGLEQKGYKVISLVRGTESQNSIEKFLKIYNIKSLETYTSNDFQFYDIDKTGFKGVPNFVIVDEKGRAVANIRPSWDSGDVLQMFDKLNQAIALRAQNDSPDQL